MRKRNKAIDPGIVPENFVYLFIIAAIDSGLSMKLPHFFKNCRGEKDIPISAPREKQDHIFGGRGIIRLFHLAVNEIALLEYFTIMCDLH